VVPPPSPPVGVSPTTGRMLVRSAPEGARVTINEQVRGQTPLDLHNMPFGEYEVRVSRDGYVPVTRQITLSAKHPIDSETVKLERQTRTAAQAPARAPAPKPPAPVPSLPAEARRPAPPVSEKAPVEKPGARPTEERAVGAVYFDSRPPGATVIVDGRAAGSTPLRIQDLSPGSHRVRFERSGFHPWATTFIVAPGSEIRVTGSLEPR
jgi:hypothetical protein